LLFYLYTFVTCLIVSFLTLLVMSYLGSGFGFGHLVKDIGKLAVVALLVAGTEYAFLQAPRPHWSFQTMTALLNAFYLRMAFFQELSNQEACGVAVACRGGHIIGLIILALMFAG